MKIDLDLTSISRYVHMSYLFVTRGDGSCPDFLIRSRSMRMTYPDTAIFGMVVFLRSVSACGVMIREIGSIQSLVHVPGYTCTAYANPLPRYWIHDKP